MASFFKTDDAKIMCNEILGREARTFFCIEDHVNILYLDHNGNTTNMFRKKFNNIGHTLYSPNTDNDQYKLLRKMGVITAEMPVGEYINTLASSGVKMDIVWLDYFGTFRGSKTTNIKPCLDWKMLFNSGILASQSVVAITVSRRLTKTEIICQKISKIVSFDYRLIRIEYKRTMAMFIFVPKIHGFSSKTNHIKMKVKKDSGRIEKVYTNIMDIKSAFENNYSGKIIKAKKYVLPRCGITPVYLRITDSDLESDSDHDSDYNKFFMISTNSPDFFISFIFTDFFLIILHLLTFKVPTIASQWLTLTR